MAIDGLYLDFKPSLFEIAQETDNQDLVTLIASTDKFRDSLKNVSDNVSYMAHLLLDQPIPAVTMGLFSNPKITVCEQYQMHIFNQVIKKLQDKELDVALKMYQTVFGSTCPSGLLRGLGDTLQGRSSSQRTMKEAYQTVKPIIDNFREKFPAKFYVCKPGESDADDQKTHHVSTETASCFSVLRELVIKEWDLDGSMVDHVASSGNPFDVQKLGISMKALLTVCKLLTP